MIWFTNIYLRINKIVELLEKIISVILISLIVLIIFSATVSRYVFNDSLLGAERLATYMMVWLGFLGFQIATSKMRHIEIEFVKARLGDKARYVMNMISYWVTAAFLFVFAFLAWDYFKISKELGNTDLILEFPIWVVIMIIPISFFASSVRCFCASFLWLDIFLGKRKESEVISKKLL